MKLSIRRFALSMVLSALAATAMMAGHSAASAAEAAFLIPPPKDMTLAKASSATANETVVLAGGCFWGVQAVFQHTTGVITAVSGYAGGDKDKAHYELVGTGATGHAESVKVIFDPRKISFGKILQIYFSVAHDPTQLNRQGPDSGTQYRSAIFYQNDAQKRIAADYIAQLDAARVYPTRIVTQLTPLPESAFYPAERYHQDFATLHPRQAYIAQFDLPKLDNLKRLFPADYRTEAVLVFPY